MKDDDKTREQLVQELAELRSQNAALKNTESAEQYRSLVENLRDAIYELDSQGVVLYISPAIRDLLGYDSSDIVGKNFIELAHKDDQRSLAEWFSELRQGHEIPSEYRVSHKSGDLRWARTQTRPIMEDGLFKGARGILLDVTAQKRMEEALRESEEKYRLVVDNMADVIAIMDMNLRFTYVSPSVIRLRGYTAEEVMAQTLEQIMTPESLQIIARVIEEEMQWEASGTADLGRTRILELEEYKKDGSTVWLENHLSSFRDKENRLEGIVALSHDITERRQAEKALRESEENLRYILKHDPNAIAVYDKNLHYLAVSDRYLQDYDIEEKNILGKHHYEVFPEMPQRWKDVHRRCLAGAIERNDDDYFERPDGSVTYNRWECRPWYQANGEIGGLITYTEVTTERKKAEKEREKLQSQLNQAQKMEAVGRLAGGVAHDFNNMLAVILGYTEMALGRVDPAQPLQADLKEIMNAAKRSAAIIRQLLAFARKQTIDPIVLDLNETVEGMLKMLRRLIGEDIDLVWRPDSGLWPVKMDPTQVEQLLANLCVNARDAIAQVGKITIETGNAAFDEAYCADHPGFVPGEYALLAISDDGRGMDRETQDKMFEPFFTTKELGQGTGLGLATVYGVVKQNNGFINVYSEPGKGTTFKIYLARQAVEDVEPQKKSEEAIPRSQGETVLVVEDEVSLLKLASEILDKLGYTVLTAGTPDKALRLVENYTGEIHLLMTDVILPEMNGRDLAKQIKAIRPAMKCLFMSGYTADVIAHRGMLDEGVQFIPKPFSMRELAAKVRTVLGSDEFPPVHGPRQFQGGER
jgi:PAS domain S-box-containing protein